jgi:hypothetical protein
MPKAAEDPSPAALQEAVIDHHDQRRVGRQQPLHDHLGDLQPQLIDRPARVGEEPVRAGVMPQLRQARADQHPGHAPQPGLRDLTDDHRPEDLKGRLREARTEKD